MNPRTSQYAHLTLAFVAAALIAHLIGPWWALSAFVASIIPTLSLISLVATWRPWWLAGIAADDEIDCLPILVVTTIVEAGALALWLAVPWLGCSVRGIGMLAQLAIIGKYRREVVPIPNHDQPTGHPNRAISD